MTFHNSIQPILNAQNNNTSIASIWNIAAKRNIRFTERRRRADQLAKQCAARQLFEETVMMDIGR